MGFEKKQSKMFGHLKKALVGMSACGGGDALVLRLADSESIAKQKIVVGLLKAKLSGDLSKTLSQVLAGQQQAIVEQREIAQQQAIDQKLAIDQQVAQKKAEIDRQLAEKKAEIDRLAGLNGNLYGVFAGENNKLIIME